VLIEVIRTGVLPAFDSVSGSVAEEPTFRFPNVWFHNGGRLKFVPIPLPTTVCGLLASVSVTVMSAVLCPELTGAKVTQMLHEALQAPLLLWGARTVPAEQYRVFPPVEQSVTAVQLRPPNAISLSLLLLKELMVNGVAREL